MAQRVRVQNFGITRDGYGAGEGQTLERPCGSRGLDHYFVREFARNTGAESMGRNKFGPQRGPWDNE